VRGRVGRARENEVGELEARFESHRLLLIKFKVPWNLFPRSEKTISQYNIKSSIGDPTGSIFPYRDSIPLRFSCDEKSLENNAKLFDSRTQVKQFTCLGPLKKAQ
jgi:hypothetical protein